MVLFTSWSVADLQQTLLSSPWAVLQAASLLHRASTCLASLLHRTSTCFKYVFFTITLLWITQCAIHVFHIHPILPWHSVCLWDYMDKDTGHVSIHVHSSLSIHLWVKSVSSVLFETGLYMQWCMSNTCLALSYARMARMQDGRPTVWPPDNIHKSPIKLATPTCYIVKCKNISLKC